MKTTNRMGATVAATFFALLGTVDSEAARLPDWAKAIADAPPQITEDTSSSDRYVVLLSERALSVREDGTVEVTDRIAKKALPGANDDVALGSILLGSNWQAKKVNAWHLRPGERAKKSRKSSIVELTDTSLFRTDNRARSIVISDVTEGSLVFFEFHAEWTPYSLSFLHVFDDEESTHQSRLELHMPTGWHVDSQWIGPTGPEATISSGTAVWELNDLLSHDPEPLTGDLLNDARVLAIALHPPVGRELTSPATFASWSDISSWISALFADRNDLSTADYTRWTEAFSEQDDTMTRIVTTVREVRNSVRYVAKEVGIDGYRPLPAAETSATLWGDCKAKSTLLQAILSHQDVAAFPVLVHAVSRHTVADRIPTLDSFNHMITAIRVGDLDLPQHVQSALLADPTLGRLLIVDSTDEFTSPGSMSSSLIGHRALIIHGADGHLITLPGTRPEDHRIEQTLDIQITNTGGARFTRTRQHWGQPAASYRIARRSTSDSWKNRIEHHIRDEWIGAQVSSVEVELETPEGSVEETVSWVVNRLPAGSLKLFAHIAEILPRVSLRRRTLPVVYDYPRTLRSEVTVQGLPAGFTPPVPSTQNGDGWTVETTCETTGGALHATLELTLENTRFEDDELQELRQLYRALASAQHASVILPDS